MAGEQIYKRIEVGNRMIEVEKIPASRECGQPSRFLESGPRDFWDEMSAN
jgi:hypothetical protein